MTAAVEFVDLEKSYGTTRALRGVTITIERGTIHSLVGQNGAGKSTLIAILEGATRMDRGEVKVHGRRVPPGSASAAHAAGVAVVHQELALFDERSVAENVAASATPIGPLGFVRRRARNRSVRAALESVGAKVDPAAIVGQLALAQQQMTEIARALYAGGSVLVLDEPTSALSDAEIGRLHATLRRLAEQGTTVIFVSHKLDEVLALSDQVTVIRDGAVVRSGSAAQESVQTLVAAVTGPAKDRRRRDSRHGELRAAGMTTDAGRKPVEIRNLRIRDVGPVTISLRPGEIVGLAGLDGSGAEEILQAIAGALRGSGSVSLASGTYQIGSIKRALRHGVVLLPASRGTEGLWLDHPIEWNLASGNLSAHARFGILSRQKMRRQAEHWMTEFGMTVHSPSQEVGQLSGGNQQRVLLARCLSTSSPHMLLLSNPTRGVDASTKQEIHDYIRALARAGTHICVTSAELDELSMLCTRVVCLRRGVVVGEVQPEASEDPHAELVHLVTHAAEPVAA